MENAKDVITNEGVKKPPTLRDIMTYGKSLIESGSNANISVLESPVRKSSDQLPITRMVGAWRIIEADDNEYEEEGE